MLAEKAVWKVAAQKTQEHYGHLQERRKMELLAACLNRSHVWYSIGLKLLQHRAVLLFGQPNVLHKVMGNTCWQSSQLLWSSISKSTVKAEHLYIWRSIWEGCAVSFWPMNSYKHLGFLCANIVKSEAFWTTPSGLAESSSLPWHHGVYLLAVPLEKTGAI